MSSFFALLSRMKNIERWSLMRSSSKENIAEHSLMTAMIAHTLAVIGNQLYGKSHNADRIAVLAMYHECAEVITGDMPTPVKYHSGAMRDIYKSIEREAEDKIVSMLPEPLQGMIGGNIRGDGSAEEMRLCKIADKISALCKCIEESESGNREFETARKATEKDIRAYKSQEADYFLSTFMDAFSKTLDEL